MYLISLIIFPPYSTRKIIISSLAHCEVYILMLSINDLENWNFFSSLTHNFSCKLFLLCRVLVDVHMGINEKINKHLPPFPQLISFIQGDEKCEIEVEEVVNEIKKFKKKKNKHMRINFMSCV